MIDNETEDRRLKGREGKKRKKPDEEKKNKEKKKKRSILDLAYS